MLTFPTKAEQALEAFASRRVPSAATAALRLGGVPEQHWDCLDFVFDDDTTLRIRGRGRNHSVEALLP